MAIRFCFLCYKGINSLGNHLRWEHPTVSLQNYYDKFFKKENDGICLNCGKETEFNNSKIKYNTYCCNYCMKHSDVYKQRCAVGVKQVWKLRTNKERKLIGQKILKTNMKDPNYLNNCRDNIRKIYNNKTEQELKEIQEKRLKSLKDTWKSKSPQEKHNIMHKRSKTVSHKYVYKNCSFHSFIEMCYYIYICENTKSKIIRNEMDFYYPYVYNGKTYLYYPDFKVDNKIIEIKGLQFFENKNPNGKFINPYDRNQDSKYEAKYKCMLENDVEIITDTKQYTDYVLNKYGRKVRID